MFRALPRSSSGGLRRNCIYAASGIVTVCRWLSCAPVKKDQPRLYYDARSARSTNHQDYTFRSILKHLNPIHDSSRRVRVLRMSVNLPTVPTCQCWKASSSSAGQDTSSILSCPKVHFRDHKSTRMQEEVILRAALFWGYYPESIGTSLPTFRKNRSHLQV